jgi:hypothetical protein
MNQAKTQMSPRKTSIILLTVATAFIHLFLAFSALSQGDMTTLMMFLVRWAFIAFTAVTIIGWVAFGARNTIAYIDKLAEVAIIVLLVTDRS